MFLLSVVSVIFLSSQYAAQSIHESDINFRVEAGARTCFFEKGYAGQMMEAYYQVLDGQHGDLDIIFEILDPNGEKLVSDYKKSQNSVIMDLTTDGDYVFCMDNSYSMMNSKLVFVYVVIENKGGEAGATGEAGSAGAAGAGQRSGEEEVLEWAGVDGAGAAYYVEVRLLAESLTRTLRRVLRARQLLELYAAGKSRDSYAAFEDTFIVDVWSAFQICFMILVGSLQVYMIKKLFNKPVYGADAIGGLY